MGVAEGLKAGSSVCGIAGIRQRERLGHMPEEQGVLLQTFVGSLVAAECLSHAPCKLLLGGPRSLKKHERREWGYAQYYIAHMQAGPAWLSAFFHLPACLGINCSGPHAAHGETLLQKTVA